MSAKPDSISKMKRATGQVEKEIQISFVIIYIIQIQRVNFYL
jgi:hypothetical protein